MSPGLEVATESNPAVTTFGMPVPTSVPNSFNYDEAIRRRSDSIGAIGDSANDFSKQLADRRVQAATTKMSSQINTASPTNKLAGTNFNNTSLVTGKGAQFKPGWRNQMAAIDKMFPGVKATSTYRPGSITTSGNLSMHSQGGGRAVDLPPTMAIYNWIKANYPNSKELIFNGGNVQIKNGKIVPKSFYGSKVMSQHGDHIHWAM